MKNPVQSKKSGDPLSTDAFVAKFSFGPPLAAQGLAPAEAGVEPLTPGQVDPLQGVALRRWQAAGVDTSRLGTIDVRITDLGGSTLGLADGNTLWLDDNAAGWGWFVDLTPWDDSEFVLPGDQGEQGKIDLLTVVLHEVGHVLGLDHDSGGVMAEALAPGVRHAPTPRRWRQARPRPRRPPPRRPMPRHRWPPWRACSPPPARPSRPRRTRPAPKR